MYQEKFIKNAERVKRGAAHRTQYKTILPSHKIKQWQSFLKDLNNKCRFIKFLCKEWRNNKYCSKLKQVTLFVAYDRECWKLTADGVVQVDSLACSHEEADTRMLFHAKKAAENRRLFLFKQMFLFLPRQWQRRLVYLYTKDEETNQEQYTLMSAAFEMLLEIESLNVFLGGIHSLGVIHSVPLQERESLQPTNWWQSHQVTVRHSHSCDAKQRYSCQFIFHYLAR